MYDNVDWNLILLYPSRAGAIGEPVPAGGDSDGRSPVLLRNYGAKLQINLVPSELDV